VTSADAVVIWVFDLLSHFYMAGVNGIISHYLSLVSCSLPFIPTFFLLLHTHTSVLSMFQNSTKIPSILSSTSFNVLRLIHLSVIQILIEFIHHNSSNNNSNNNSDNKRQYIKIISSEKFFHQTKHWDFWSEFFVTKRLQFISILHHHHHRCRRRCHNSLALFNIITRNLTNTTLPIDVEIITRNLSSHLSISTRSKCVQYTLTDYYTTQSSSSSTQVELAIPVLSFIVF
jgi:hypothetical protein